MKICVVGGTGNISTSIVRLLLDRGHQVTIFNRGQHRIPPDGVRLIQGDRYNPEEYEGQLRTEQFDAVIDMMCFTADDARSSLRAFPDVGHYLQCSTVCTYGIDYDWFPATEDHPLRPITDYGHNKAAADAIFLEAFYGRGYPVTIIKPSTTYGPQQGMTRQIAWDFSWIDRIRQGKPIVVCGDGNALHQHLHVDDAALGFVGVLGKPHTLGQTYNLVDRGYITWADYHRTAMKILNREVELVGIPFADLQAAGIPEFGICEEIFAHHVYYCAEKLFRDAPEFQPTISLEKGMAEVIEHMDREDRIPDSDTITWEDDIIHAQRAFRRSLSI
jgi:nucleoside-diphosphate-sugar epimerase